MHVKLHYWGDISGRSMPLIYILNHSKIEWEQCDLPLEIETQAKWMARKQELITKGFPFTNLPCLEVTEKESSEPYFISQTNYCATFLGEKCGYGGKTEQEKHRLGQAMVQFDDFQKFWFEIIMCEAPKSQKQDDQMKSKLPEMLTVFENCLKVYHSKFLISDNLTTIDFMLFHWSAMLIKFKPSLFTSGFPLLDQWYKNMLLDESIAKTKQIHDSLPFTIQYKDHMGPFIEGLEEMPDCDLKTQTLIKMRGLPDLHFGTADKGWDAVYE